MILILSNKEDITTDHIIDWLVHYEVDYLRWEDNLKIIDVEKTNHKVLLKLSHLGNIKQINISDVRSVLYRKGYVSYELNKYVSQEPIVKQIQTYESREVDSLINSVWSSLMPITIGSKYADFFLSKVSQLDIAKKFGLKEIVIINS